MKAATIHVAGFFLALAVLQADMPTPTELAARLDRIRRPTKSFTVRIVLTEIRQGKPDRTGEYRVFARKVAGYPDFETLTLCLSPASDRGKVALTKKSSAWFYDPKAARPVAVPYGKFRDKYFVSYGLTASFMQEYDAESAGIETIPDAARKERSCHHLVLRLRDAFKGATPETLHYWVDVDNLRLVRAHICNADGKVLRTVYYTDFVNVLDEDRPTHLPVISGTEPGLITDVRFKDLAYREIPAGLFTPEAMPQISKGELP